MWRRVVLGIALTICVSTVFVKQHSIVDMVWGFGFSLTAWRIVYGRPLESEVQAALPDTF